MVASSKNRSCVPEKMAGGDRSRQNSTATPMMMGMQGEPSPDSTGHFSIPSGAKPTPRLLALPSTYNLKTAPSVFVRRADACQIDNPQWRRQATAQLRGVRTSTKLLSNHNTAKSKFKMVRSILQFVSKKGYLESPLKEPNRNQS